MVLKQLRKNKSLVLIVEDEVAMLKAIANALSEVGFEVLEAQDGEQGLALAVEKHPDLILLDLVMPKMDGLTMLKQLRQDKWGKIVKVILLTHMSETDRVAEALSYGAFQYLYKPDWDLGDVVEQVRKALK
ncbi:MAG: response regulator [Patescibacteria group bacterium]